MNVRPYLHTQLSYRRKIERGSWNNNEVHLTIALRSCPVGDEMIILELFALYLSTARWKSRSCLQFQLYDLDGNEYDEEDVVQIYYDVTAKYKENNPKFMGAKVIYAPLRIANNSHFLHYMDVCRRLHVSNCPDSLYKFPLRSGRRNWEATKGGSLLTLDKYSSLQAKFPDFVIGFDLVGQEDSGRPLIDFADQILTLPPTIKFFFHAGETNWSGQTDENLVSNDISGGRAGRVFASFDDWGSTHLKYLHLKSYDWREIS